ncbi:MAG: hypothetical protein MUC65_01715 [Pontiellaceae bacterium]|jgi:hypothetical protein|nr:hypothetical protein [Pontiellaceae bacterium]
MVPEDFTLWQRVLLRGKVSPFERGWHRMCFAEDGRDYAANRKKLFFGGFVVGVFGFRRGYGKVFQHYASSGKNEYSGENHSSVQR